MCPRASVPFLLLVLAGAGCRSAAADPGLPPEAPAPGEVRIYAVADILKHLDRVPLRGCCVLPMPTAQAVSFPYAWERALTDAPRELPAREQLHLEEMLDAIRKMEAARTEGELRWITSSVGTVEAGSVRLFSRSEEALLEHVQGRLAVAPGGPMPCRLDFKEGPTLVARGSPAALAVVERSLAELR